MAIPIHAKHSGRKIITRSKTTLREIVKPRDGGPARGFESKIQSNWFLVLQWDRGIDECYEEVKGRIIRHENGDFRYFPDFEVIKSDGTVDFIEIKPFRRAIKKEIVEKHAKIGEYLNDMGMGFRVLTERCLPVNNVAISNLRRLKWYQIQGETSLEELGRIVWDLPATLGELAEKYSEQKVMEMLARQFAYINLEEPISNQTKIRAITEADYVGSY